MASFNCRIVLVRPRNPNNIGAAARAMKNFGFTDLTVVAPHAPVWDEAVSAVNAVDIIANARVVGSLIEAISDCTFVVGTVDRTRVESKQAIYTPADLSRDLQATDHRLAMVFGPEKNGLTTEDLSHCHRALSIPTRPLCPSMNLGQAVAVCCYELMRDRAQHQGSGGRDRGAGTGSLRDPTHHSTSFESHDPAAAGEIDASCGAEMPQVSQQVGDSLVGNRIVDASRLRGCEKTAAGDSYTVRIGRFDNGSLRIESWSCEKFHACLLFVTGCFNTREGQAGG